MVDGHATATFQPRSSSVLFSLHTPDAAALVTLTVDDLRAALHALIDADVFPVASTIWKAFAKLPSSPRV
jgi:hypothetical protein